MSRSNSIADSVGSSYSGRFPRQNTSNFKTLFYTTSADKRDGNLLSCAMWENENEPRETRKYHDEYDVSRHPSYSVKNVKYSLACAHNYKEAKRKYNDQLCSEMRFLADCKTKRVDEYAIKKLFNYLTFWPPLHTRAELKLFVEQFFQLPPKKKKHLYYLMNNEIF